MSAITVQLTPANRQAITERYTLRRPEDVYAFLSEHPFLLPVLLEAPGPIARHFGEAARLVLGVVTDMEVEDWHELFILIRTDLPPEEAIKRLHALDGDWWLERSRDTSSDLCIHVTFS